MKEFMLKIQQVGSVMWYNENAKILSRTVYAYQFNVIGRDVLFNKVDPAKRKTIEQLRHTICNTTDLAITKQYITTL